jgi:hypothetical protein
LAKRLLVDSPQKDTELIRQLRVAISETLRARGLLPIPKVRGEPAVRWDGLQLADMLAGMIADGYLAEETILPRLGDRLEVFEHIPQ